MNPFLTMNQRVLWTAALSFFLLFGTNLCADDAKPENAPPVKEEKTDKAEKPAQEPEKDKPETEKTDKKDEPKKDEPKKDPEPAEKKDEPKKEEPKKEEPKPDTVELKKEPLRITVKLNGQFEPKQAETVQLKAKEFAAFELQEVVEHASKVLKGDTLVRFNPKKYDEALIARKRELRLSEIALQEEEIALKFLERTKPMDKEARERDKKEGDDDFLYAYNVEWEWTKKMLDFAHTANDINLESVKEELRQLEKMYAEDDLIEDTEEFILKRQRLAVESRQFIHDMNKDDLDRTRDVLFPRTERQMKESAKRRELNYQKNTETFEFALEQAKLKLEKTRETHSKLLESFARFEKDKEFLTLKSPADGMVYYGEYNAKAAGKGKWNNAAQVAAALKIGEPVLNGQVLLTVVDTKPSAVQAAIAEKDLHWIDTGTQGVTVPSAFPESRYKVRVVSRNAVPSPANDFNAVLSVDLPGNAKVYPGMTCSVELTVYDKKETLLVPATALKREEDEEDSWNHAYLFVDESGKAVKKKVQTGQVKGDKTELLGGVDAGAKVYKKFDDGAKAIEK